MEFAAEPICDLEEDDQGESLIDFEHDNDDDDDEDGVVGPARNIAVLTDEEREYIIDMIFNQGMPVVQLATEIGCTKEAVYGVTRAFRTHNRQRISGHNASAIMTLDTIGVTSPDHKGTSSSMVDGLTVSPIIKKMYNQQEEELLLKKYIRENKFITVKQLQHYINCQSDTFPGIRSLSKRTLYRILKRCRSEANISTMPTSEQQKPLSTLAPAVDNRVLQERLRYAQDMTRYEKRNPSKIVYIDICGCQLTSEKLLEKSSFLQQESGTSRGGPLSFCAALTERGILLASLKQKPFTTDEFLGFLHELANKLPKARHVFVLDAAPFNKVPAVLNYIKGSGHAVKYLPRSSPFLNPLQEAFDIIKTRACASASSSSNLRPRNLMSLLAAAKQSVTVEQIFACIANTRLYYAKCLKREDVV